MKGADVVVVVVVAVDDDDDDDDGAPDGDPWDTAELRILASISLSNSSGDMYNHASESLGWS